MADQDFRVAPPLEGQGGYFVGPVGSRVKVITQDGSQHLFANGQGIVALSTAITSGVTVTTLPNGTLVITSHATGVGTIFISDGAHLNALSTTPSIGKVAKVALSALDTGGGVLSWQNPEAGAIIVNRIQLDITTKSTIASTIDVGTTAVSATTSSNNLLTALDSGTAAGTFDNFANPGASGKFLQKLATGKWVTASRASGACAGLVGFAYIHYTVV